MHDESRMNRINPDGTAWNGDIRWAFIPPLIWVVFLVAFILAILAK
jgi:hypothetical protein